MRTVMTGGHFLVFHRLCFISNQSFAQKYTSFNENQISESILRKTIEGYLDIDQSLTFNIIKTELIMYAF